MNIRITLPKRYSYIKLRKKTFKYFKIEYKYRKDKIIEDKNKKYYIFLFKNYLGIDVYDETALKEIKSYLEFLFKGTYIGITNNEKIDLSLENVKVFNLC